VRRLSGFTTEHVDTGANMTRSKQVNDVTDSVGWCHRDHLEAIDG